MNPQLHSQTEPQLCCAPDEIVSLSDADADAELAKLATALSHPARVAIIRFLKEKGVCICGEIVEVLPLAQSTVSQHLKVLKSAGWVQGEVDGPRTCYCLNPRASERFRALLDAL